MTNSGKIKGGLFRTMDIGDTLIIEDECGDIKITFMEMDGRELRINIKADKRHSIKIDDPRVGEFEI